MRPYVKLLGLLVWLWWYVNCLITYLLACLYVIVICLSNRRWFRLCRRKLSPASLRRASRSCVLMVTFEFAKLSRPLFTRYVSVIVSCLFVFPGEESRVLWWACLSVCLYVWVSVLRHVSVPTGMLYIPLLLEISDRKSYVDSEMQPLACCSDDRIVFWRLLTLALGLATIDATTLWDLWDTSHPTLEIRWTKCIWSPPTFATIFDIFRWALREAKFKGKMERKDK